MKETLVEMIKRHEGFSNVIYKCPNFFDSIGYGHKITKNDNFKHGVKYSKETLTKVLETDIANAQFYMRMLVGTWDLPKVAKDIVTCMIFQIGSGGIQKFKKFLKALKEHNFLECKKEMLDSKWARSDSPHRALELANLMGDLM